MKVKVIEHARYGKCRVGEEGWIVGRDVARILGYANADGFVRKHVTAQNKRLDSVRALDSFHCARTALINQAGLDELLAATDNPDAAEIKAWLLSESARPNAVHSEESNSLPQVLVPQLFNHPQFGNLRAVNIGGEPFFIGSDVAKALGYRNTRQAIIDHVPDKFKKDGVAIRDSVGGTNSPILINEAGLYKLIMCSRLPEAEKFSDWACGEVLPSIRKDGCYVAPEQNNNLLQAQINTLKAENALLRNQLPALPSLAMAVVYVLLLSNGSIKIGVTDCLPRRIKEIELETNLRVLNFKSTPYLLRNEAENLESFLKDKFSDQLLTGEFFSARFDEVAALIS